MELGAHNYKNVQVLVSKTMQCHKYHWVLQPFFSFMQEVVLDFFLTNCICLFACSPSSSFSAASFSFSFSRSSLLSLNWCSVTVCCKRLALSDKNVFCFVHHSAALIEWTAATTARRGWEVQVFQIWKHLVEKRYTKVRLQNMEAAHWDIIRQSLKNRDVVVPL